MGEYKMDIESFEDMLLNKHIEQKYGNMTREQRIRALRDSVRKLAEDMRHINSQLDKLKGRVKT
jgi:predicted  nucleic acid-binding Zn-ribbon protein